MKSILLILMLFTGVYSYSQAYQCTFKVQNVETYPAAKELISIIRGKYNTEENPKYVTVKFNSETQEFNIISTAVVGQEELSALMGEYSYMLSNFRSFVFTTKENESHE